MSATILRPRSRLHVARSALLKRVLQFNYALAGDIHHSNLDTLGGPPELIARIRMRPRGTIKLTQVLNESTGFIPLVPRDFVSTQLQAALLPGPELIRLIQMCVAALLCEPICNEIERRRRIELEHALPPNVLRFARHRCRMTAAPFASRTLKNLLPGLAEESPCWPSRIDDMCRVVCDALWQTYPLAVRDRVTLKLPRAWQASTAQLSHSMHAASESAWRLALRLLETELLEDWMTCFN